MQFRKDPLRYDCKKGADDECHGKKTGGIVTKGAKSFCCGPESSNSFKHENLAKVIADLHCDLNPTDAVNVRMVLQFRAVEAPSTVPLSTSRRVPKKFKLR